MSMTHSELVERDSKWLANYMRCPIVITEMGSGFEIPDAIGWTTGGGSILIECKASKSDYEADKWKPGRRTPPQFGMGNHRYYLVPPDLVGHVVANRPEHWGVLIAYKKRVEMKATGEWLKEVSKSREMNLLISSIRRIAGTKNPLIGMNVKVYTINENTKPVATLGIKLENELAKGD